jgi:DNA-directed RNA polymerase alpha subunit
MTNWDRVVLNVKTDGTITYKEAFEESVKMLLEQFGALLSPATGEIAETEAEIKVSEEVVEEADKKKKSKK